MSSISPDTKQASDIGGCSPRNRTRRMLWPESIAVLGASADINKMSGQIAPAIGAGGFPGPVYLVNPKYDEIDGLRCYDDLTEIGRPIDHCVIAVAAPGVEAALRACAEYGVGGATVLASGFGELGESGRAMERALDQAAGEMPFIGPNCMGFADIPARTFVTSAAGAAACARMAPGGLSVISQSGGLAFASVGYLAAAAEIGFRLVVSAGNATGVSFASMLAALNEDELTDTVLILAESERCVAEAVEFMTTTGTDKPVVLLKTGRSQAGVAMVESHTGALTQGGRLSTDVAEQAGMLCVRDVDEAIGAIQLAQSGRALVPMANRPVQPVAAVSISGGNLALMADAFSECGIKFADLEDDTVARIRDVLPRFVRVGNPVDLTAVGAGGPQVTERVIDVLADDPNVATIMPIITTLPDYSDTARVFARFAARHPGRLAVLWVGGAQDANSYHLIREADIPVFPYSNLAGRVLEAATNHAEARLAACQTGPSSSFGADGLLPKGRLAESDAYQWLARWQIPTPRWEACSRDRIIESAERVGYPVVVKIDSAETHQSRQGGVLVDVRSTAELTTRLSGNWDVIDRVLVAQYLPGHEVICSTFGHPEFGRMLMVGSGGVDTETEDDAYFAQLPASRARIATLALRCRSVRRALRSGLQSQVGELVSVLCRVADIGGSMPSDVQIELNPITVGPRGCVAVDAAIRGV